MTAATDLHVQVGEPVQEWCHVCLTSARLTWPLFFLEIDGMTPCGSMSRCLTCSPLTEEIPDA